MEIKGPDFVARRKTRSRLKLTVGTEEESFELSVLPPTKRIVDDLLKVSDMIGKADDESASSVDLDECLEFVAESMSHNAECRAVTSEYLRSIEFDITDIGEYIGAYLTFIGSLTSGKN